MCLVVSTEPTSLLQVVIQTMLGSTRSGTPLFLQQARRTEGVWVVKMRCWRLAGRRSWPLDAAQTSGETGSLSFAIECRLNDRKWHEHLAGLDYVAARTDPPGKAPKEAPHHN